MDLHQKKCVACEGGLLALDRKSAEFFLGQLDKWSLSADAKKIRKAFEFEDFKQALAFINRVGELAETEGHHPDLFNSYNKVSIELWTHAIQGLSENDFILAAKIDRL